MSTPQCGDDQPAVFLFLYAKKISAGYRGVLRGDLFKF